jgi:predicted RNA methylase
MAEDDLSTQLRAVDRWASRRDRAIEFLRRNGFCGLVAKVREAGISETAGFMKRQVRYQICSFFSAQWDRKYGVDTSGQIDLTDIDVVGPNKLSGYASVATSPHAFAFLSAFFPPDWKEFTFVDIGSGKGRVLMLAALRGFDTILGVEFAPLICQIAERNLAHFSGRRPAKWSVVNADASTVDLPLGVPLLIYSFNPFKVEMWERFLPVLLKANEVSKKPMCLVLSGTIPETLHDAATLIEGTGRFRARARGVTPFFADAYAPYAFWVFDAI